MKKIFILLSNLLLLLLVQPALCQDFKKEFNTNFGFSLYLNNEWSELPQDFLEQNNKGQKSKWDMGYILSNENLSSGYRPNILVKINESGRVPASVFKKYKKTPEEVNDKYRKNNNQTVFGNISVIEYYFDDESYTLHSSSIIKLENIGRILSHGRIIFTEKGYIEIVAYSPESEADKYSPFFKEVFETINIDKSLKYKKSSSDLIPTNVYSELKHILNYFVGASIAVLFYAIIKRKKRKRK